MADGEIERRKTRWNRLWNRENGVRDIIYINVGDPNANRPNPIPENKAARVDWAWNIYRTRMEMTEWLKDDFIPYLDVYTGTEIFAHAFGCKIHVPPDNMPCAMPMIHDAVEVARLKVPRWSDTPLVDLFDMADELRRRAGSDAVVRVPDIQSPMDIAALIWDKNEFFVALVQEPRAVKDLADKVKELFTAFFDDWFRRYGTEFIAHCPNDYYPRGITLSEDEAGAVNTDMFEEFFLPELVDLSNHYGGLGMHCCANARHQWDNFKKIPDLKLLNICQPAQIVREAFEQFGDRVVHQHGWMGDGPVWDRRNQIPVPKNIPCIFETTVKDRSEAVETLDRFRSTI